MSQSDLVIEGGITPGSPYAGKICAPVILVSGFDRCGSSLMMQMLNAGGIPVTGEAPIFQDDRECGLAGPPNLDWLPQVQGCAVKVLYPNLLPIPSGSYRAIWLDRDPGEQAKSMAKLVRATSGIVLGPRVTARIADYNRTNRTAAREALVAAGATIFDAQFERLCDPVESPGLVEQLAAYLERGIDQGAMLKVIAPRDALCAPGVEPGIVEYSRRAAARAWRGATPLSQMVGELLRA